jgi:hypothetical protein
MPLNDLAKRIIHHGNANQVLASVTLDLISRRQRPYLFRAKVVGQPPHAYIRYYDVTGWHEDGAALKALEIFKNEMANPLLKWLTSTEGGR